MFPQSTRTPDITELDAKIVPLVVAINQLGIPTYYSCEGHEVNRGMIQSPYPMVAVTREDNPEDWYQIIRLLGMIGIHNSNCHSSKDICWVLSPISATELVLRPGDDYHSIEELHKGVNALAKNLELMMQWYDPRKQQK